MKEFPDFKDNIYYQREFDAEQKKMADMNIKSPLIFMIYFKLLYFYRDNLRRR
jgi:glycosyltransferase EpsH